MARRVPRPSYQAAAPAQRDIKPSDDDDQEDLYSDPFRDNQRQQNHTSRQISSTPAPQSRETSFNSSPLQSPSTYLSDKENAPQRSKHQGSQSPFVKKERGLSVQSSRSVPYHIPSQNMPPTSSRSSAASALNGSRGSIASARTLSRHPTNTVSPKPPNAASKAASSRSQNSRTSHVSGRAGSAAPSRTSRPSKTLSRGASVASDAEIQSENEEIEEDPDAEGEADVDMDGAEPQTSPEDDEESEAEAEPQPDLTQRSRVSETPAPSRARQSLASQLPSATQQPSASQATPSSQRPPSTQFYDPRQSQAERMRVRSSYNQIQQDLIDNKRQLLKPGNTGLLEYIEKAGELFNDVKQTTDAVVDGRIQVEIGKLAAEKARLVGNSGTNTGLDIDQFIAKTIQFMSKSRESGSSQGHDWKYLATHVATPAMKRARPSDFMLGPLAVQKRARVIKARKQVVRRRADEFIKPIDLDDKEIAKSENSTSKYTQEIAQLLDDYIAENDVGEVGYFNFVVNPHSFSQTIENMFYVAFLVRDGRVAIMEEAEYGLPYLIPSVPPTPEESREQQIVRKQIVMPMDKKTWRELIDAFQIKDTIIPSRAKDAAAANTTGWYT